MDHHPNPSPPSSSYNLADIWHQFPLTANAALEHSNGPSVLGARRPNFLHGFPETLDESTLTEQHTGRNAGAPKKRRDALVSEDDSSSKLLSTSSGNEMNDIDAKRLRICGTRDENGDPKAEVEATSGIADKPAEQISQPSDTPKQDYIHVRARRGQATDSHSLAERARREKISERMKILQDLVPGCNKVIGKAMVLDEIINYIQSLQRQVEFLSMKLEAVNSRVNPIMDVYPPKDFGTPTYDAAGLAFGQQATRDYGQGSPPEWLHMQVGGNFERAT